MAQEWALGSAVLFAAFTALRICLNPKSRWQSLIPGGIAVAVGKYLVVTLRLPFALANAPTLLMPGMYNVPSFTLARTVGGVLSWWWRSRMGWAETPLIVLASVSLAGGVLHLDGRRAIPLLTGVDSRASFSGRVS